MKMTNFVYSLKISWLKRITTQTEGWAEFLIEMGIQKVIKYGDQYLTKLKHKLNNKFWIDMINGIQVLTSKFRIKNTPQLYSMPLWHNSRLQFEYRQDWGKKGYQILGDILNEDGILMSTHELINKGLKINFLDHFILKKGLMIYK